MTPIRILGISGLYIGFSFDWLRLYINDFPLDWGAEEYITESVGQVLVDFGVPQRWGDITQATGSTAKTWRWSGILKGKNAIKQKEILEQYTRVGDPYPIRLYYNGDKFNAFIVNFTAKIRDNCTVYYDIELKEYIPEKIVAIPEKVWWELPKEWDFGKGDDNPFEKSTQCDNVSATCDCKDMSYLSFDEIGEALGITNLSKFSTLVDDLEIVQAIENKRYLSHGLWTKPTEDWYLNGVLITSIKDCPKITSCLKDTLYYLYAVVIINAVTNFGLITLGLSEVKARIFASCMTIQGKSGDEDKIKNLATTLIMKLLEKECINISIGGIHNAPILIPDENGVYEINPFLLKEMSKLYCDPMNKPINFSSLIKVCKDIKLFIPPECYKECLEAAKES